MAHPLISVCVRTDPRVEVALIQKQVVGRVGRLKPSAERTKFWATTAMTLKQVRAVRGVKDCVLTTGTW